MDHVLLHVLICTERQIRFPECFSEEGYDYYDLITCEILFKVKMGQPASIAVFVYPLGRGEYRLD